MDELVFGLGWSPSEVMGMTLDEVRYWYNRALRRQQPKYRDL